MPDVRISELPAAATPADGDLAPLVQTSGGALETRRATLAQLRNAVLADRGAHVRDYGAVGDGVTNDAPAIQAAINDLKTKGGGTLSFGPRIYRIASAIVLSDATIRLQGAGFTEGPSPAQGTWLLVDGTGFTPFTFTGVYARGAAVRDIAVAQPHTAAQNAAWAPTDYDFVFRVEDCLGGVDFDNVFLCNVARGIYARNSGRLDIRRLRGQVFRTGVEIDQCYDIPRLHSVHFWPFWSSDTNIIRWQQANGDAMVFRRCDGVFIDQAFALGYRSMFRFAASASGVTTKFYIAQAYTDFCQYGVLVEANGTDGQIGSLTHQGEIFNAGGPPLAGGVGLCVNASNTRIQAANLRIDAVEDNAIRLTGSGNRLDVFSLRCVRYNTRNNGAVAVQVADSGAAAPNAVYLGSQPLLEAGNGGPLTDAGGTNAVFALGAPAGRAARPGLALGGTDTGLFQPAGGGLAAAAGGAEVLRATAAGAVTLGAAPGGHALEVATPIAGANRVVVAGGSAGAAVGVQAQGADANIDLYVVAKGSGLVRTGTAAAGDNSTAIATTAWVRAQGYSTAQAGGGIAPVTSVAGRIGDVVLTTADIGGFATAAAAAAPVTRVAGRTGTVTLTTADIGGFATAAAAAAPVASVAGRTGAVTLTTADIGGFATAAAAAAPVASVAGRTGTVTLTTADIGGFATAVAAAAPVVSVAGRTGAVTLALADIAGAAPLATPAFTGSPTAPTPAAADSSTALATTAWAWSRPAQLQLADTTAAGGNARGANATDWQGGRSLATQVASGAQATIGGGGNNTASATAATVAGGSGNTAGGQYAWVPGGFQADARGHYGRAAWAAGRFASAGDAQAGEFVLRRQTTDATATTLTADGQAAGTANLVNLPNGGTYCARVLVVARQTGGTAGTAGDSAGWTRDILFKRGATAAATVAINPGTATAIAPGFNDTAAAAWRIAFSADTTNGGIVIAVTGEANKAINWVARILSVEVVG